MSNFRSDFYAQILGASFDLNAPGIYQWEIEGVGIYVGKALKLRSRIRAYPNNVRRMVAGLHWHGDPSKEFRPIHKHLREAHDNGTKVIVKVLENCHRDTRAEREQHWISQRLVEYRNGGPRLLNAGF